ncbi:MAG: glycosyltransferase [Planctomycetota bacterium]|nr:glycosyltransferase [Planctomycetota bacterium]
MKILQVVHAYPPGSRAGVETFTQNLSTYLSQDHEIHVLAFDITAPRHLRGQVSKTKEGAIQFHFFPNPTSKERKRKHAPIEQYFKQLLDTEKPDIVHFQHLSRYPPSLPSLAKERQIPYVVHLHDFWYLCPTVNLFEGNSSACTGPTKNKCFQCIHGKAANPVLDFFELRHLTKRLEVNTQTLKEAALIISVSHNTRLVHESYGAPKSKLIVLPPALDLVNYAKPGPRGRAQPTGPLHVAFMGFANRIKGFHVLLDALKETSGDIQLTAYGNVGAEFITATAKAIKESQLKYRHHGRYDRTELPEILSRIDVVVLPSLCYETYGLGIVEAFSAGIPVIASRIGGMQERVFERRSGFLFPPGDSQRLASILDQLASDYDQSCKSMDFQGRVPSFSGNAQRIVEHYQNLLTDQPLEPAVLEGRQLLKTLNEAIETDSEEPEKGQEWLRELSSGAILMRKRVLDLLLANPTIHSVLLGGDYSLLLAMEAKNLGFQCSLYSEGAQGDLTSKILGLNSMDVVTNSQLGEAHFDALVVEGFLNSEKPFIKLDDLSKALQKGSFLILSKVFPEPIAPLDISLWDDGLPDLKDAMKNYGFRWLATQLAPDRCYYMFQLGLQGTAISK